MRFRPSQRGQPNRGQSVLQTPKIVSPQREGVDPIAAALCVGWMHPLQGLVRPLFRLEQLGPQRLNLPEQEFEAEVCPSRSSAHRWAHDAPGSPWDGVRFCKISVPHSNADRASPGTWRLAVRRGLDPVHRRVHQSLPDASKMTPSVSRQRLSEFVTAKPASMKAPRPIGFT